MAGRMALVGVVLIAAGMAPAGPIEFEGKGVFEVASSQPHKMRVADFNADGRLDILVPCQGSDNDYGEVTVLVNLGSGAFNDDAFAAGYHPWGSAAGDFDGDGCVDIAITNSGNGFGDVHVYANDCSAGFDAGAVVNAGSFPVDAETGFFDADAHLDLAVANNVSGGVTVFRGDGEGGFAFVQSVPASNCTDLAMADFDLDGRPDLVLGTYSSTTVLMNDGDGTFSPGAGIANDHAGDVATADFNADGNPDAASVGHYSGVMTVALGNGDGSFGAAESFDTGGGFVKGLAAADLTGDGYAELIVTDGDGDWVRVYEGNGDGTFASPLTITTDWQPEDVVVGDFNDDGAPDLAVGCRNLGDTALVDVFIQVPQEVCTPDVNGDGVLNILDFVAFQGAWQAQAPAGDCDGNGLFNILDFVCFQGLFQAGCP